MKAETKKFYTDIINAIGTLKTGTTTEKVALRLFTRWGGNDLFTDDLLALTKTFLSKIQTDTPPDVEAKEKAYAELMVGIRENKCETLQRQNFVFGEDGTRIKSTPDEVKKGRIKRSDLVQMEYDGKEVRSFLQTGCFFKKTTPQEIPRIDIEALLSARKKNEAILKERAKNPNSMILGEAKIKTYLIVGFKDKDRARESGAKWDKDAKAWYVDEGANLNSVKEWLEENAKQKSESSSRFSSTDLISALQDEGLSVGSMGDLILDGSFHRIGVEEKSGVGADGWYRGSEREEDGFLGCTFGNHTRDTGDKGLYWEGNTDGSVASKEDQTREVTPEERERRAVVFQEKKELEEKKKAELHEFTSGESVQVFEKATPADADNPYLKKKQALTHDLRVDWRGTLLIPLSDVDGKLWSLQRIWEQENKETNKMEFQKRVGIIPTKKQRAMGVEYRSRKDELFYVVGAGHEKLSSLDVLLIGEGLTTCDAFYQSTKIPTIMAIDAGNMMKVARVLQAKYPNKEIVIIADNDERNILRGKSKVNKGIKVANEIVAELGVKTIIPEISQLDIAAGDSDWNDIFVRHGGDKVAEQYDAFAKKELDRKPIKKREVEGHNDKEEGKHP